MPFMATSRSRLRVHLVAALFLTSAVSVAEETTPSAASLVQGAIDQEHQIHAVRSLHLRFKGTTVVSDKKLEKRAADHRKRTVGKEPPAELLRANRSEELEIALAPARLREVWGRDVRTTRIWDGRQFKWAQVGGDGACHATIRNAVSDFEFLFGHLAYFRLEPHDVWYHKDGADQRQVGLPEDYRLAGKENVGGEGCYVLENPVARRCLHICIADGRPRRLASLTNHSGGDFLRETSRAANREFADNSQVNDWIETLTPDEWKAFEVRLAHCLTRRSCTNTLITARFRPGSGFRESSDACISKPMAREVPS
jgi:hypothetical protein